MNLTVLNRVEEQISRMTLEEQLWLMERLAHRIRESGSGEPWTIEEQLTAMADDPEIRRELLQIEREFAHAEADGLDSD